MSKTARTKADGLPGASIALSASAVCAAGVCVTIGSEPPKAADDEERRRQLAQAFIKADAVIREAIHCYEQDLIREWRRDRSAKCWETSPYKKFADDMEILYGTLNEVKRLLDSNASWPELAAAVERVRQLTRARLWRADLANWQKFLAGEHKR